MTIDIKALLKNEEQLLLSIEVLTEEIAQLESSLSNPTNHVMGTVVGPTDNEEFDAPEWCIPIKTDVLSFEWNTLGSHVQFDCILMDPPWQLASHQPTRGVALGYQQLPDLLIESLPIDKIQTNGFIFIWVINNKYVKAFELMQKWGYK